MIDLLIYYHLPNIIKSYHIASNDCPIALQLCEATTVSGAPVNAVPGAGTDSDPVTELDQMAQSAMMLCQEDIQKCHSDPQGSCDSDQENLPVQSACEMQVELSKSFQAISRDNEQNRTSHQCNIGGVPEEPLNARAQENPMLGNSISLFQILFQVLDPSNLGQPAQQMEDEGDVPKLFD